MDALESTLKRYEDKIASLTHRLEIKGERLARSEKSLASALDVLAQIAAQSSGVPGSRRRSDCMAAMASANLGKWSKQG